MYLVGFMGAGKTAVGRCAAQRFDRRFVDLDEAIEERVGISIREIFETRGEAEFRRIETWELEGTVASSDLVVATGGGAFSSADNRRMIRDSGGVSVFLDPPWSVIRRRLVGAQAGRPKWIDEDQARRLFLERRDDYLTASIRLELEGDEDPDEVAEKVCRAMAEVPCAS